MRQARSAASCDGRSVRAEAAVRRARSARPSDPWEVSVLAQIGDDAAGRQDLLRERRERTYRRRTTGSAQHARGDIECDLVAVAHDLHGVLGLERRDAEIDAVAEEDPREALRDDGSDAELLQRRHRVLARRAAAEVL